MARPFLSDEGKIALTEAIQAIEDRSSAEIVFAVRPRSGSYVHADLIVGLVVAWAVLAFLLFSPWDFALIYFLTDPVVAGALAAFLSSRLGVLRRLLTTTAARRRRVETAARARFVEKRVHQTRGRTGLLVYVSILEKDAEVVADVGVEAAVPQDAWSAAAERIAATVRRGGDAVAVAAATRELGPLLEQALPRAEDDVNELVDEVCEAS